MNTLVILFAASATEYAFKPCFDASSAYERTLRWAKEIENIERIDIFVSSTTSDLVKNSNSEVAIPLEVICQNEWSVATLLQTAAQRSKDFERVVFAWADCPFYDRALTSELLHTHTEYNAEYTFADGYPVGLTPEIVYPGTLSLLSELLKDKTDEVSRDVLFASLRTDINAFEIETILSPIDTRQLRLSFTCNTKRNTLACQRLFSELSEDVSAQNICEQVGTMASVQRTLPAFYALQIASPSNESYAYSPYVSQYKSHYGMSPLEAEKYMNFDNYVQLLKNISDFSGDAVISLSLWGESLLHPQILDFIKEALAYSHYSLLIETDGLSVTEDIAKAIASIVSDSPKRQIEQSAINWVVCIDAVDEALYTQIHGINALEKAKSTVMLLSSLFPNAVYPQFLRTTDNEEQLEGFYRYWKETLNTVLIQKYDSFAGVLENKKVADLSPILRNPCWHIKRDMYILLDGSVTQCKNTFFKNMYGNAFEDSLESIWNNGDSLFAAHLKSAYTGICDKCDEYYTFNF